MAEYSVQSAVQRLGSFLVEEEENLRPIKEKVEQIRDELDWMHCFLREADANRYVDPRVCRWVINIQEIAYEAEEIVENFLFKFISHQKQEFGGKTFVIKNKLERYLWVFGEAKAIHDASNDIEALRAKIATLTSRLQAYGIKITRSESGVSTSKENAIDVIREDKIIGLNDQVKRIVGELVDETGENKVFGIWGTSGVGKTTLAKEIFFDYEIRKHFERFSWVNVPRNCKIIGLLRRIITSITTKSIDEISIMTEQELINDLYEVLLEKKCLVILDNVWSCDIWDTINVAFPEDDDKDSRSKILFTTENMEVAEEMHEGAIIHEVKCFSYDESWELLQSKMGGFAALIFENDDTSPKMMEMVKKMLKFCQGIPLAIIALGGLLVTKKTPVEWEILLDLMSSHHNAKNQQQQSYEKVIELCYYALPYYLKNCFLQLGRFPEDFEIPTRKLCNMLVAEGIVVLANSEVSKEESLEGFAENCLNELLQRGMVLVSKRKSSKGSVKFYRLHDLMRNLCLKISKEENFQSIMDLDSNEVVNGKIRRLAIYLGEEAKEIVLPPKNPILRSLLLLPSQKERPEVNHVSVKSLCRDSQLLRVLDLEGVVVSSKTLPREIGDFIYLRYLSVRDMLLTKLPPTIGCLKRLETLDLRAKVRLEIPNVLWCLEKLRNLYLPYYFTIKDSEILRLDNLKNLLTLKNVNHFLIQDVLAMKKLKKASVRYMLENEHIEFIQKSPKVEFGLTIFRAIIGKDQVNVLISFDNLIKLELKGEVSVPINTFEFPPNLKKLVLDFCGITQDPMPVLEKLPRLTSLCLDHQAYVGEKMICTALGFPRLTYLRFHGLKSLQEWITEKGAMINLKYLE
ncbi:hypothetical protein RDABS01_019532, partial [Bienertia sinuspersici]